MKRPDYIFIVGLGRTGSTLTRHILNCSEEVGIGGESHFFRDLPRLGFQSRRGVRRRLAQVGDLRTDTGAEKITDYLFSIQQRHLNFWNLRQKHIDRQEFLAQLLASDRTERALFDLVMRIHAQGKPVRGEKTPAHIFDVPTLLDWFPNSKIIHTYRDPRAIFTSRKKKSEKKKQQLLNSMVRKSGLAFEMISSLHVIINWSRVNSLHQQYQQQFPNRYTLLKYEDLVCSPQASISGLCDFLGIEFTETMLQQTTINSSYLPDGAAGFDRAGVDRWREHLDPLLNRWFLLWCGNELQKLNYRS